jgi:hypothetical protein
MELYQQALPTLTHFLIESINRFRAFKLLKNAQIERLKYILSSLIVLLKKSKI